MMIENTVCQINIISALWVFAVPMCYSLQGLTHVIPTELIRELSHAFHHHQPIPVIRQCTCPINSWLVYNLWLPRSRVRPPELQKPFKKS